MVKFHHKVPHLQAAASGPELLIEVACFTSPMLYTTSSISFQITVDEELSRIFQSRERGSGVGRS